jgi:hypothetical protein
MCYCSIEKMSSSLKHPRVLNTAVTSTSTFNAAAAAAAAASAAATVLFQHQQQFRPFCKMQSVSNTLATIRTTQMSTHI